MENHRSELNPNKTIDVGGRTGVDKTDWADDEKEHFSFSIAPPGNNEGKLTTPATRKIPVAREAAGGDAEAPLKKRGSTEKTPVEVAVEEEVDSVQGPHSDEDPSAAPEASSKEARRERLEATGGTADVRGGGVMITLSILAVAFFMATGVFFAISQISEPQVEGSFSLGSTVFSSLIDLIYCLPILLAALTKPWSKTGMAERIFILLPIISCAYYLIQEIPAIGAAEFSPDPYMSIWDISSIEDYFVLMSVIGLALMVFALAILATRPGKGAAILLWVSFVFDFLGSLFYGINTVPQGVAQLGSGYSDALTAAVLPACAAIANTLGIVFIYCALLTYNRIKRRLIRFSAN